MRVTLPQMFAMGAFLSLAAGFALHSYYYFVLALVWTVLSILSTPRKR